MSIDFIKPYLQFKIFHVRRKHISQKQIYTKPIIDGEFYLASEARYAWGSFSASHQHDLILKGARGAKKRGPWAPQSVSQFSDELLG